MQHRSVIANVIVDNVNDDERVVGAILYQMMPQTVHLVYLTIHPDFRRRGFGSGMVQYIINKVERSGRKYVTIDVREDILDLLLFLRRLGFEAVEQRRQAYNERDVIRLVRFIGKKTERSDEIKETESEPEPAQV